jgi:hypothetical protein
VELIGYQNGRWNLEDTRMVEDIRIACISRKILDWEEAVDLEGYHNGLFVYMKK